MKHPELSTSQLSLYFKEPSTLKITYVLAFTSSDIFNEPCRMSCSVRGWSQYCQGRPGKHYCHNLFDNSEKKDFSQNNSNSVIFFFSFFTCWPSMVRSQSPILSLSCCFIAEFTFQSNWYKCVDDASLSQIKIRASRKKNTQDIKSSPGPSVMNPAIIT